MLDLQIRAGGEQGGYSRKEPMNKAFFSGDNDSVPLDLWTDFPSLLHTLGGVTSLWETVGLAPLQAAQRLRLMAAVKGGEDISVSVVSREEGRRGL